MTNYIYNPKDTFVDDLQRPIRVGDIGLNASRTYSFTVTRLSSNDKGLVRWIQANGMPHCITCGNENEFGCQELSFYTLFSGTKQHLHWLAKPKKTIVILSKV